MKKTIYIDPETWGPDYLWHPSVFVDWGDEGAGISQPAMCCLGFACHQLGTPLDLLDSTSLPSDLLEYSSKLPKEVETFITQCQRAASADFVESALQLITGSSSLNSNNGHITWKYENLLSRVNDWYHRLNDEDKPSKLEPTLEVLKLGFKKMGYELVYGKSC